MSLDLKRLEKLRELANGVTQARCPACAEDGGDRKGDHLRIYPDGRYGCCVHPKDAQHRKRIFALAGALRTGDSRGQFTVKVAPATRSAESARSVKGDLGVGVRTLRTGDLNSWYEENLCSGGAVEAQPNSRTLRTPFSNPRAYAREDHSCDPYIYKDLENGVLSVLRKEERPKVPFLTADGTLSIPFASPGRYHWWKSGGERMTVDEILAEVKARAEEVANGTSF